MKEVGEACFLFPNVVSGRGAAGQAGFMGTVTHKQVYLCCQVIGSNAGWGSFSILETARTQCKSAQGLLPKFLDIIERNDTRKQYTEIGGGVCAFVYSRLDLGGVFCS